MTGCLYKSFCEGLKKSNGQKLITDDYFRDVCSVGEPRSLDMYRCPVRIVCQTVLREYHPELGKNVQIMPILFEDVKELTDALNKAFPRFT